MKKLSLLSLVASAVLFIALGASSAGAEGMKCGAGKCGDSMKAPVKKCGAEKKDAKKCGSEKKDVKKCGAEKKDDAKCGKSK